MPSQSSFDQNTQSFNLDTLTLAKDVWHSHMLLIHPCSGTTHKSTLYSQTIKFGSKIPSLS